MYNEDAKYALDQATQCGIVSPRRQTRRENLEYRRSQVVSELDAIDKALAALDAHPELEQFIETLARVGA